MIFVSLSCNAFMQHIIAQLTEADLKRIIQESVSSVLQSPIIPSSAVYDDEYLTQAETAKYLRASKQSIISWTRQGRLKATRIGRKVLYSKRQVINLGGVA